MARTKNVSRNPTDEKTAFEDKEEKPAELDHFGLKLWTVNDMGVLFVQVRDNVNKHFGVPEGLTTQKSRPVTIDGKTISIEAVGFHVRYSFFLTRKFRIMK